MISPVLMLGGKSLSHSFYNSTLAIYALCFSGGCWCLKKKLQALKPQRRIKFTKAQREDFEECQKLTQSISSIGSFPGLPLLPDPVRLMLLLVSELFCGLIGPGGAWNCSPIPAILVTLNSKPGISGVSATASLAPDEATELERRARSWFRWYSCVWIRGPTGALMVVGGRTRRMLWYTSVLSRSSPRIMRDFSAPLSAGGSSKAKSRQRHTRVSTAGSRGLA